MYATRIWGAPYRMGSIQAMNAHASDFPEYPQQHMKAYEKCCLPMRVLTHQWALLMRGEFQSLRSHPHLSKMKRRHDVSTNYGVILHNQNLLPPCQYLECAIVIVSIYFTMRHCITTRIWNNVMYAWSFSYWYLRFFRYRDKRTIVLPGRDNFIMKSENNQKAEVICRRLPCRPLLFFDYYLRYTLRMINLNILFLRRLRPSMLSSLIHDRAVFCPGDALF